ncbi:hypothetical protein ACLOJK_037168 [Asimina triloba]
MTRPPQNHAADKPILLRHVSNVDNNAIAALTVDDAFVSLAGKPITPDRHSSNPSHPSSPQRRPHPRSVKIFIGLLKPLDPTIDHHNGSPEHLLLSPIRPSILPALIYHTNNSQRIPPTLIVIIHQANDINPTPPASIPSTVDRAYTAAAIIALVAAFTASHNAIRHQRRRPSPLPPSCLRNPCELPPSRRQQCWHVGVGVALSQ